MTFGLDVSTFITAMMFLYLFSYLSSDRSVRDNMTILDKENDVGLYEDIYKESLNNYEFTEENLKSKSFKNNSIN